MQVVPQRKRMAAEVAAAVAHEVRELTVTITVKARVADDSPLAPLVVKALQEFIAKCPDTAVGVFESKAGLDVSWDVKDVLLSSLKGH